VTRDGYAAAVDSRADRSPVVSVVLIAFNDRHRLGRAVQSVLSQPGPAVELVVVDDGSTDGTADVAAEWARRDPRVRVVTRPSNSGGCGAPRNDGLDAATGRYLMFLDSDDELEPGAVARLVATAERSGVDVVIGRTQRVNPDVGSVVPWRPALFERLGVTSLAARPELVGDTLVVDKLYRRELIESANLRFPTDLHYEDLVFTAQLYAACRSVEVTAIPVYRWYVRAREGDRSITNRRAELSNLADRVEASRRADQALAAAGRDDLRVANDRKFLEQDLALYLRDLPDRDREFGRGLLSVLTPYLASLRPEVRDSGTQPGALVLALIAAGDLRGLDDAASLAYRERVARPLLRADGQWLWPGLPPPAGDVTPLVDRLVRWGLYVDHRATALWVEDDRVHVTAITTDPLGLVRRPARMRLLVLARARGRPLSLRVARARVGLRGAQGATWQASLPLGAALRAADVPGEIQVRVVAWRGGRLGLDPLFLDEDVVRDVTFELRSAGARPFRNAAGRLALTRTR
jgi:CDP-glycerol glycerophosphotransferase